MIRYFAGSGKNFKEVESLEDASWVHVNGQDELSHLERLTTALGITTDYITDPLDIEERARYEKYDEARSII